MNHTTVQYEYGTLRWGICDRVEGYLTRMVTKKYRTLVGSNFDLPWEKTARHGRHWIDGISAERIQEGISISAGRANERVELLAGLGDMHRSDPPESQDDNRMSVRRKGRYRGDTGSKREI